ncbi:MAG: GerMN domain-containing protein [Acidimicrobiales bacterium]
MGDVTRRRLVAALVATLTALALAACGISTESTPREINDVVEDATDETRTPTPGSGQIFLVQANVAGAPSRLVPVSRELETDPASVFEVLMAGPTDDEKADSTSSFLPTSLELRSSVLRSAVVELDVSDDLLGLASAQLVFALAQIVYTYDGLPGVDGVRITVEGQRQAWPDVNGQLQSDVLTVFDYPGLVRTTQPAFPAVPSA